MELICEACWSETDELFEDSDGNFVCEDCLMEDIWNERKEMELDVKLKNGAPLPRHAKSGDAGMDLTVREDVVIPPFDTVIVGTGVSVEIPEGYVGLVFPRSGLASKRGITLANCVGVVDSGYRGEIMAPLHNMKNYTQIVLEGERVCQLVIMPFETCICRSVKSLSDSERGETGFGSSGMMQHEE